MKKKKWMLIGIISVAVVVLTGMILTVLYVKEQNRVLTAEELIAYYDLSEEEIEGVDVERFLYNNKYTKEALKRQKMGKEDILEFLAYYPKWEAEGVVGRDFFYIVCGDALNGRVPDYSQLKYLAFQVSEDEEYSIFIDVQEGTVYVHSFFEGTEYVYCDIQSATRVKEDVDLRKLIRCLESLQLENWEAEYKKDVVYGTSWDLGLEFLDGTIASYSGYEAFPEGYRDLKNILLELGREE